MRVAGEAGEDEEVCIQKEGEYMRIEYFNFLWSSFIRDDFNFLLVIDCWKMNHGPIVDIIPGYHSTLVNLLDPQQASCFRKTCIHNPYDSYLL